ncbi:MAG: elongation factor 4, partial [Parcubacteria group bacterium]|nr:elongation factor 4 [Parcubacteria group bacterium]
SRSLAACEGAILLVDATQGIQAQTVANLSLAREHGLTIIPVINKIDLPNADIEKTRVELATLLGVPPSDILAISAKTGENVTALLTTVMERVPSPTGDPDASLSALVFDSFYDTYKGVVASVRVFDGTIKKGEVARLMRRDGTAQILEVGVYAPEFRPVAELSAGEVGYIVTDLKEIGDFRVGETVTHEARRVAHAIAGYREPKPMVFAGLFPESHEHFQELREALTRLKLNDAALSFEPTRVGSLGLGFRVGCLGLLHLEIVTERLSREFGVTPLVTTPQVAYHLHRQGGDLREVTTAGELPEPHVIEELEEPWVNLEIITPATSLGVIYGVIKERRGTVKKSTTQYLGGDRIMIYAEMPLANMITDFFDALKSASRGYASLNYEVAGYRPADLVRLDILIAGERVEALARIVHRTVVVKEGRMLVESLKNLLPHEQFAVALQAAVGGTIIARETIPAERKDVTAKLYGGDVTRKRKLLERQKKGKKRLREFGRVSIPSEVFLKLLKRPSS